MTEPFVGQIMMCGFDFAPRGFALCNGQLLGIAQNQVLFSLLGTYYGGNGTTNFALPNLQGRTPVAAGSSADPSWAPTPYPIGAVGGVEAVTLTLQQIPAHQHQGNGTTAEANQRNPTNTLYGTTSLPIYAASGETQVLLSPQSVAAAGGGQPHSNMQPFNVINFCIALQGIYPSRN
ncbi:phage tail protein [Ensifer sp. ENS11]|uniref:phage tail protein n=1 Tax=Ensifer sp. ENS11 TaxID=2769291 RepID=UPI00178306FB|nr:tail fiber protein [Ensifer sp. ENS11]MBD9491186.1 phage tail protein [Ensifer sp. ENS11]